jgi:hypothetical protein
VRQRHFTTDPLACRAVALKTHRPRNRKAAVTASRRYLDPAGICRCRDAFDPERTPVVRGLANGPLGPLKQELNTCNS